MRSSQSTRAKLVLAALLCVCAASHAQSSVRPATSSFAAEPYYFKTFSDVISMHADGTGSRVETISVVVQSEAALHDLGVAVLVYPNQSEHADFVYARVIHPDGSMQETPVASAIEQPVAVTAQAPQYSDLKSKQLPIRSLKVGDTLEWQTRFVIDHPTVPNQFWGQNTFLKNVVVLDQSYELHVPAGLHLTVWTNSRSGVTPAESDAAGEHIYRWQHTDLKLTVGPAAEAAKKAEELRPRTPDEGLDSTKGVLPDFAWSTFPDYAALGAWYRSIAADRIAPDAAIRAKVAELTAGKSTEIEKADAVYNYVSSQIHYIGVEFGIGAYQPHSAAEVFANQYGDCKDKHTLLASMLSVLNIPADPVLIGAGIRFNSAVATPSSFNHLITHITLAGKDVFLDSTTEVAPWQSLLNVIRDHEALLIPASGPPVIRQTPKDLPYPQVASMSVNGSLDNALASDSSVSVIFHDDDELYIRAALRAVSPSNYGESVQRFMGAMGFGGTTSEAAINNLDDPSKPLEIAFHYHRAKEKDWGDNRITVAFQALDAPAFAPDRPPTTAIQLGAPRVITSTVRMELPKGWSAILPDAVHAHTPYVQCDVTYSVAGGILNARRSYTVLEKEVPFKDSKQYLSWYEDAGASGVPFIQLTPPAKPVADAVLKMPTPVAPAAADPAHPSDAKAADLIRDAFKSLQTMDLDAGRKYLDDAAKLNPTQPRLWYGYATIAQLLGKQTEVAADLQHELTYHPEETPLYQTLYQYQIQLQQPTAAVQTLRAWQKAAPDDPTPPMRLVSALTDSKQYPDAIREGRQAIDRLQPSHPDLIALRVAVATAQAKAGQTAEAAAAVEPLLKTTTDAAEINSIDALLADTSTNLDRVHAAQQAVLDYEEKLTADWSLSTPITPDVLRQETALAQVWDTFGWILFKQGNRDDAFAYCLASASLLGTRSAHDHLSAIAAVTHKSVQGYISNKSDQDLRTFPLATNGHHGTAAVKLVLAGGKIVEKQVQATPHGSPSQLDDIDALLAGVDLRALFPPGSPARLVRQAYVNCFMDTCNLAFMPVTPPPTAGRTTSITRP